MLNECNWRFSGLYIIGYGIEKFVFYFPLFYQLNPYFCTKANDNPWLLFHFVSILIIENENADLVIMVVIFFVFSFFAKNKKKFCFFCAKTKKKQKIFLYLYFNSYTLISNAIFSSKWSLIQKCSGIKFFG